MGKKVLFAALGLLVVAAAVWVIWSNVTVELHRITVQSAGLPTAFDGARIAHVSDLHNASFGEDNQTLLQLLRQSQPDIIAITGDLIDSRRTDVETAARFVEQAVQIAPVYYVTGNHESRIPQAFAQLEESMTAAGAQILRNQSLYWEREGQRVQLIGLDDPSFLVQESQLEDHLRALQDEDCYQILLSHRPELFDVYAAAGVDLSLTGHAHGGQFRIPFVGGVFAPAQGFFPRYDAGLYLQGQSAMVVSRGIGQSVIPVRLNNRPEIVLIELRREADSAQKVHEY